MQIFDHGRGVPASLVSCTLRGKCSPVPTSLSGEYSEVLDVSVLSSLLIAMHGRAKKIQVNGLAARCPRTLTKIHDESLLHFEFGAVQKYVTLVDLVTSFPTVPVLFVSCKIARSRTRRTRRAPAVHVLGRPVRAFLCILVH